MLAVDTNAVVRLIVADDQEQARKARRLFADNRVFIGNTVLLETEWVLRSNYALPPHRVRTLLFELCGLPQVVLESPDRVAAALDWFARGMDFADAMHLAASGENCEAFATFDRKLVAAAKKAKTGRVKSL